jgi:hypothetical protein
MRSVINGKLSPLVSLSHLNKQPDDVVLDATVNSHHFDGVTFPKHSGLLETYKNNERISSSSTGGNMFCSRIISIITAYT